MCDCDNDICLACTTDYLVSLFYEMGFQSRVGDGLGNGVVKIHLECNVDDDVVEFWTSVSERNVEQIRNGEIFFHGKSKGIEILMINQETIHMKLDEIDSYSHVITPNNPILPSVLIESADSDIVEYVNYLNNLMYVFGFGLSKPIASAHN